MSSYGLRLPYSVVWSVHGEVNNPLETKCSRGVQVLGFELYRKIYRIMQKSLIKRAFLMRLAASAQS